MLTPSPTEFLCVYTKIVASLYAQQGANKVLIVMLPSLDFGVHSNPVTRERIVLIPTGLQDWKLRL